MYDIHILGMKSKSIPKEVADMGEFIREMIKDNVFPGLKGGGSHFHAQAVIPNQLEFICDTCEQTLHKGDWFCQRHRDGKLWCKECWNSRDGGEVKPARLKTLSRLRAKLRTILKTLLNRETSSPEETIASSNLALGTKNDRNFRKKI